MFRIPATGTSDTPQGMLPRHSVAVSVLCVRREMKGKPDSGSFSPSPVSRNQDKKTEAILC